jgi:predicted ATPase
LRALDDAFAIAKRTGENFFLAEVYRLQGEIALTLGGPTAVEDAERYFTRSLEVARKQTAVSWELRTSVSLASLWRDLGKRQRAADLLWPTVSKFGEGFETTDLKEAVALMTELRLASSGDQA